MNNIKFVLEANKGKIDLETVMCSQCTSNLEKMVDKLSKAKKKNRKMTLSAQKQLKEVHKMHRKMMRKYKQLSQ